MTEAQKRRDFYRNLKRGDKVEYTRCNRDPFVVKEIATVVSNEMVTFTDGTVYKSLQHNRIQPIGGW